MEGVFRLPANPGMVCMGVCCLGAPNVAPETMGVRDVDGGGRIVTPFGKSAIAVDDKMLLGVIVAIETGSAPLDDGDGGEGVGS